MDSDALQAPLTCIPGGLSAEREREGGVSLSTGAFLRNKITSLETFMDFLVEKESVYELINEVKLPSRAHGDHRLSPDLTGR